MSACHSSNSPNKEASGFQLVQDDHAGTISVFRQGGTDPLVVQNAHPNMRPFLHPIMAPDGNGTLTEMAPGHHKHQTGVYWGFTRVNGGNAPIDTIKKWFYRQDIPEPIQEQIGRDYFHHNGEGFWERVSMTTLIDSGDQVKWKTVYHLLDDNGEAIMRESQTWLLQEAGQKLLLSLEWEGTALQEITVNEFDYGGLFIRMPWNEEIEAEVVNAARQRNQQGDKQRAMWVDIGMEIPGRNDWGHIAIFDHQQNEGFPTPWRIDGQFGVGPSLAIAGDWQIPEGQTKIVKHQLVAYTGEFDDVEMRKLWDQYIGSNSIYSAAAMWTIARQEGLQAEFLTPEKAVEVMTVEPGYQVDVWAAEPMLTQPMAFCWDDKGRMWVAENRDYENRGSGFSNDGTSRILILEDTDRDGQADTRKVFLEGIPFPAAIAVGFDGLYLGAPPNLLFIPDRNGDDRADMEDIEVLLTGWGIRDRHETLNSLHWGPDGWLYGLEGFATPSKIRRPTGNGKIYGHKEPFPDVLEGEGVEINGGVWRFHPVKKEFEVVAHGFSNPWGIDYDSKGQLFITACVIPHMFHVIPGGIYHRQGGQHFNPYVYQDIRTIVDHSHRSAHGGARIYQSDAFPSEQHGRLFMANIHEHAILSDILEPKGSGFIAKHADDFVMANNAQWIGFSMEIGPDGDLYVLDWHDGDICGNSVLQKETGRIFRVSPENTQAQDWQGRYADLNRFSDLELAKLQTSLSDWHARRARVILQARAAKGAIDNEAIKVLHQQLIEGTDADYRLRALWTLHVSQHLGRERLLDLLSDQDQYIRAWAVQLLCEDQNPTESTLTRFSQMATDETSAVVRLYLAAALQRIPESNRWAIINALLTHNEDANDHNIPKMIWFGFEPLVAKHPEKALEIAAQGTIPLIAEFTARRVVDADNINTLITSIDKLTQNRPALLTGFLQGLEGRTDLSAPPVWKSAYKTLAKDQETASLALAISQQFGDSEAAAKYVETVTSGGASMDRRNHAIKALAAKQRAELKPVLPELWEIPELRIEAIRALAAYQDRELAEELLAFYPGLNEQEKLEVIQTMASRPVYGNLLVSELKDGSIPKSDVPVYAARQLRRVVGNGFVEVWGPIDELSIDKEKEMAKYQVLLNSEVLSDADLENGKLVFNRSCGACHQMYGQGGLLGPDLTGSNRENLDYLLSNMLDPNGDIQDDYKMEIITTRDGRTYTGNIASENDRQLVLRIVGQDQVTINTSNIQSRETASKSMMPEGLLQTLTDQEVIDLVGFLQFQQEQQL
jgi:putative membrane-bound dehydrogenase-like protein